MRNKAILFFIVIFSTCFAGFAQTGDNHGLILRGTAYDGTVEMYDDYAIWRAKLRMEFVNEGSKPIILINPFTEYGGWKSKIDFITEDFVFMKNSQGINLGELKELVFSKSIKKSESVIERFNELAEGLDSETPPQNFTRIIEPNGSFQFEDEIAIKQTYSVNVDYLGIRTGGWEDPSCTTKDYYCGKPISSYKLFKINYSISLVKNQENPDLLENSQAKWKKFGVLPVDTNGGFTIITEPIKNIKYKLTDKTTEDRIRFRRIR